MATTITLLTGERVDEVEVHAIAVEAYLYLYPLVMMDVTRRQMTNSEGGERPGFGPMNNFSHMRAVPPVEFKAVPWPNSDTLYSLAWLDLAEEPLVMSVPDSERPLLHASGAGHVDRGLRRAGQTHHRDPAGHFAIVPPGWPGELPAGVRRIDAPTPVVWVMGRTQTNGPEDYPAVNQVQDGLTVTPLSRWGQAPQPVAVTIDPGIDMTTPPVEQVNRMAAAGYFACAAELMKIHPPHVTDWSMLARMRRIGLEPGKNFDLQAVDPAIRQALEQAPAAAQQAMQAKVPKLAPQVNGWQMPTETMGVYGNYYLKRAALAMIGLGSNPPEDAIYPLTFVDGDGQPLSGENDYVLRFDSNELPPVNAFWSLTLYDTNGFQVANPLDRRALGDRDPLRYEADGSLELFIQDEHPGSHREGG